MEKPVALILLVFSISGLVFGTQPSSADNNASDICETHACVHAASRIIRMGNPSVEPCDDFYEFACGSFVNPTESDRNSIEMDTFTGLTYKFNKKLEKILEQNITINDFKYLKLAKTLYKICLKKNDIFANSVEPSGGWPVLKGSKWNETAFDFNKTIFRVDNTTRWENYFFKFNSYDDYSSVIVEPYPSDLTADYYIQGRNNIYVNGYYNLMIQYAQAMNASDKNTNYADDFEKLINLEIELGSARLTLNQTLNALFDTVNMTLNELEKNYSFFNWNEYITYLRGSPVNSSTTIIIKDFSYMKKLQDLLNSTVTKRTLANYVMYKHLRAYDSLTDIWSPEYKQCAEFVSSKLPIAVGAIYVQNFNHSKMINTEDNILKMTLKIKEKFLGFIKEADWIDPETEKKMQEKLQLSNNIIGYINEFTNNSKINKIHEDLELIDENNFFDATARIVMKTLISDYKISLSMARTPATFAVLLNSIVISYKLFESELFDSEQPNYINYGAMGSIIGHEITHGFDIVGKLFDAKGHLNDIWTPTSTQNFNNKSKCIIEQYSSYTVKELGLHLNGDISQGENVADLGGIRAAYRAYSDLSTTDKRLPGLFYTPKQMFWISYATMWCQKTTPELLKMHITDSHPPYKFRVTGTLSNMPEFAKDFKCPSGSNMNPVNKCSVW